MIELIAIEIQIIIMPLLPGVPYVHSYIHTFSGSGSGSGSGIRKIIECYRALDVNTANMQTLNNMPLN